MQSYSDALSKTIPFGVYAREGGGRCAAGCVVIGRLDSSSSAQMQAVKTVRL